MERTTREHWAQVAQEYLLKASQSASKSTKRTIIRNISQSASAFDCESKHRNEREVDLLLKVAQASFICGKYQQAADAFEKAGCLLYGEDERIPSALFFCEAGFCREMISVGRGEDNFKKAVSLYCDDEKYSQAARIRKWIAEHHESNKNYNAAIDEFKLTCQYYKAAGMDDQVYFIEHKMSNLLAMIGSLEEASELYYNIGLRETSMNLMKYSANQSFFRSCLLLLAIENYSRDAIKDRMVMAKQADFRFGISAGFEFLVNILDLIENTTDVRTFADHIYDYDEMFPFNDLELQLLEKIYKFNFQHVNASIKV